MKSRKVTTLILMTFSLLLSMSTGLGGMAFGEPSAVDLAIKGYDPVAYFTVGKALKGNESFTFQWHGMTWYFTSAQADFSGQ